MQALESTHKFLDSRKYAENPTGSSEKSRRYYAKHREKVLARRRARAEELGSRPAPVRKHRWCSECGELPEGRQTVVCSKRRCKDARYRRLHPEEYAAKERRKYERRRDQKRGSTREKTG